MVYKIHDIMLEDRSEKAKKVNVSNEHIFNILHKHLSMKYCDLLTLYKKQTHVTLRVRMVVEQKRLSLA